MRQFAAFHDRPTTVLAVSAGRRLAAIRSGMVLATGRPLLTQHPMGCQPYLMSSTHYMMLSPSSETK